MSSAFMQFKKEWFTLLTSSMNKNMLIIEMYFKHFKEPIWLEPSSLQPKNKSHKRPGNNVHLN